MARVALRATVPEDDSQKQFFRMDVEVVGDHEVFSSPSDFTADVTREALQNFKSIAIEAAGDACHAKVTLRWRRSWWVPGFDNDAEVLLEVSGPDDEVVEKAFTRIRSAIRRGGTEGETPQSLITLATCFGSAAALTLGTAFGLYLLKMPGDVITFGSIGAAGLGFIGGAFFGTWMYPSLEVAPAGQTHLRRLLKFGVPIILTLVISGITKALYH